MQKFKTKLAIKIPIKIQRAFMFFPAALVITELALFVQFIQKPTWVLGISILLTPYLLPLSCYKVFNFLTPLKSGTSFITAEDYCPWILAHRIQVIYLFFPFLERMLRLIPGLFSMWLRLWGSRIGRAVYWTPRIEVLDRTHLQIGDYVFFGDDVRLSPHIVKKKNGQFILYVKEIQIDSHAFIGAFARLAPGVKVDSGLQVPVATDLYPNQRFEAHKPIQAEATA